MTSFDSSEKEERGWCEIYQKDPKSTRWQTVEMAFTQPIILPANSSSLKVTFLNFLSSFVIELFHFQLHRSDN